MEKTELLHINTIRDILSFNAARLPLKDALLFKNSEGNVDSITYRKLMNNVNYIGSALLKRGVGSKNIAVIGKNSCEWCMAYFAVCCGAGTVVPIDRETLKENLADIFRFVSVKAVFADRATLTKLDSVKKSLPKKLLVISLEKESVFGEPTIYNLIDEGRELVENGFEDYLKADVAPERTAALLFTSGTTAAAKVVMLSDSNICSDIMSVAKRVDISDNDSTLCVLPLHHAYQTIVFLVLLYVGGTVSFCEGLRHVSENLSFYKPTMFVTVPLMLEKMHKKIFQKLSQQSGIKRVFSTGRMSFLMEHFELSDLRKYVYSLIHEAFGGNLKMIVVGAAAMNPDIAKDFESFGIPVIIGYGLTECSPIAICNSSKSHLPDSIGKPLDGAMVILDNIDESGCGEICVKGPMVMQGYYKNRKATAAVLENGWLRTGDIGYCDDEGNYHITGRSKNVIVTKGGKNVYPEELEYYLNNDPIVQESMIFGDSDGEEEHVAAQVIPDEDAIREKLNKEKLSKDDIQKAISDAVRRINKILPSYKSIRHVFIREDEFEKTSTHKIRRSRNSKTDDEAESEKQPEAGSSQE